MWWNGPFLKDLKELFKLIFSIWDGGSYYECKRPTDTLNTCWVYWFIRWLQKIVSLQWIREKQPFRNRYRGTDIILVHEKTYGLLPRMWRNLKETLLLKSMAKITNIISLGAWKHIAIFMLLMFYACRM